MDKSTPPVAFVGISEGKWVKIVAPLEAVDFDSYRCIEWHGRGKGHDKAIHFMAFNQKNKKRAFEAFVAVTDGGLKVVWKSMTGFTGESGEKEGTFFDYEPPSPSSSFVMPIIYRLSENVQICGFGPAPYDVRMYDPSTVRFRPVVFDRLRRLKRGSVKKWWGEVELSAQKMHFDIEDITGSFVDAKETTTRYFGNILIFEAASSSLLRNGKATSGVAPASLTDGDREKGWVEGVGGAGAGEFVTAKTISSKVDIKGLRFSLAYGSSRKKSMKLARLKEFYITVEDGRIYRVKVPSDPSKKNSRDFIVKFPEPVNTGCISIIIGDVFPPDGGAIMNTFIGEVKAITNLSTPSEFASFANELARENMETEIDRVLSVIEEKGFELLAKAWDGMNDEAKADIARYARKYLKGEGILDFVGKEFGYFVDKGDFDSIKNLARDLGKLPSFCLSAFENQKATEIRKLTTLCLFFKGYSEAVSAVVDAYLDSWGKTDRAYGFWGHTFLDSVMEEGFKNGLRHRDEIEEGGGSKESYGKKLCEFLKKKVFTAEMLKDASYHLPLIKLIYHSARAGIARCANDFSISLWNYAESFSEKYYLLDAIGKQILSGSCEQCWGKIIASGLIHSALHDEEPAIRAGAIRIIERHAPSATGVEKEVEELLDDPSPWVRKVALLTAARVCGERIKGKIVAIAGRDLWPEVRAEAVRVLLNYESVDIGSIILFLKDTSPEVIKWSIRLAVKQGVSNEEVGKIMVAIAANKQMRWDVREEAAGSFGQLCLKGFEKQLALIAEAGMYPDSTEGDIYASAAAIASLGKLKWKDALDVLEAGVGEGKRREIRISSIIALGEIGGQRAKHILRRIVNSADIEMKMLAESYLKGESSPQTCR